MKTQISGNILKRFGKFKVISALNYLYRWQNGKFNSSGTKAKKWASQEIVKNTMSPRYVTPIGHPDMSPRYVTPYVTPYITPYFTPKLRSKSFTHTQ